MAIKLSSERNYIFPVFSIALALYCYHRLGERREVTNIESSFKNYHPFLYKLLNPAIMALGFIYSFDHIIDFISVVKDSYNQEFKEHIERYKRELIKIEKYDLHQLEKKLPLYFSIDYNANICKEKYPIVIFLDTYESHVNELACVGYEYENDLWLRDKKYGIVSIFANV